MLETGRAALVVQGGPNGGQTIPLAGRPITIGRRPDNDVVVDESTVSRRHALIMETPTGFVLRDLSSTNGTFVNRERVGIEEYVLKHGDKIRLAGSEVYFIFRQEGAPTRKMSVDPARTGEMVGDMDESTVDSIAERAMPQLGGKEAELLKLLESKRTTAISREEIARHVWPELLMGSDANHQIERTVELLRAQIEEDPSAPTHLITVGEFGFLLI